MDSFLGILVGMNRIQQLRLLVLFDVVVFLTSRTDLSSISYENYLWALGDSWEEYYESPRYYLIVRVFKK